MRASTQSFRRARVVSGAYLGPAAKTVVVLEDRPHRVWWLKGFLAGHRVRHSSTVNDFLALTKKRPPDLVILDHDLGDYDGGNGEQDRNGKDGRDAARALDVATRTPILIWSHNKWGAQQMEAILRERGFTCALRARYGTRKADVGIMTAVRGGK